MSLGAFEQPIHTGPSWGTGLAADGDHILAAIDYHALWDHLCNFR